MLCMITWKYSVRIFIVFYENGTSTKSLFTNYAKSSDQKLTEENLQFYLNVKNFSPSVIYKINNS